MVLLSISPRLGTEGSRLTTPRGDGWCGGVYSNRRVSHWGPVSPSLTQRLVVVPLAGGVGVVPVRFEVGGRSDGNQSTVSTGRTWGHRRMGDGRRGTVEAVIVSKVHLRRRWGSGLVET